MGLEQADVRIILLFTPLNLYLPSLW